MATVGESRHEQRTRLTAEAFNDPQPGDEFTEMLSFWVVVVDRVDEWLLIIEGSGPVTFPDEGKVTHLTCSEFRERFAYKSSGMAGRYSVKLERRGINVAGWRDVCAPRAVRPEQRVPPTWLIPRRIDLPRPETGVVMVRVSREFAKGVNVETNDGHRITARLVDNPDGTADMMFTRQLLPTWRGRIGQPDAGEEA